MKTEEKQAIENAIKKNKGNLTEAAKTLGIQRGTLYRKIKEHSIDPMKLRPRKI